jgi:hypothetical protein
MPYVCPDHVDERVDHHGRGCRACVLNAERKAGRRRQREAEEADVDQRIRAMFKGDKA